MKASLRMVRTVYLVMLAASGAYVYLAERLGQHRSTMANRNFYFSITGTAIIELLVMFLLRRSMIGRSALVLASDPENQASLRRWRAGHIVTYAFCISLSLYGIVLRSVGFTFAQVMPFYLACIVLMLYFFPRDPSSNMG